MRDAETVLTDPDRYRVLYDLGCAFAARLELEHPTTKAKLVLEVPRDHLPEWARANYLA